MPTGDGQLVSPTAQGLVRWQGILLDAVGIANAICVDLQQRIDHGTAKYGTPLRTHNGRDAKIDAYQEVLDAIHYYQQDYLESPDQGMFADLTAFVQLAIKMRKRLDARTP
jgi:hypothetical protein